MRQQVVRAAHDDLGHFAAEKTLLRLCEHYWFPRMRQYVEKYISCCLPCIYGKKPSGKKEGFLNPIPKKSEPFDTLHIDHYGPLPKTRKEEIFTIYGKPRVLISDRGSAFTSKKANGQVERFNRTLKSALLTSCCEEDKWDEYLPKIQFAMNNIKSKVTGPTASELLHGFRPRSGIDSELIDEVRQLPRVLENIVTIREKIGNRIETEASKQKLRSRKMNYRIVNQWSLRVLPNCTIRVSDMSNSHRTRNKRTYENVVAVDHIKPWQQPGGVADDTDAGSGSDGLRVDDVSDSSDDC
ncbi:uncharacterized protein LOC115891939 [Sitophilus oryzae]|uniref:Uncharacterized protein LOC115891939 n=1 Tax=Sitophilus oryzae TaxID=7048 RepID=A0A6J2YYX0_SITOR|nr:uncharacterized protein LOC115891939 [Sitophilus oryzae]